MIPTKDDIQQMFIHFNNVIFNGTLPIPTIDIVQSRSFFGKFCFKKQGLLFVNKTYTIKISNLFDIAQDMIEDVLLHEMIHFYIIYKGIKDKSAHGPKFKELLRYINTKYNRNIQISIKLHTTENIVTQRKRVSYICLLEPKNNQQQVILALKSSILNIIKLLQHNNLYFKWYTSTDPYWQQFSRSKTRGKIYAIKTEEVQMHLVDAVPYNYINNK